jgi:uncharacterized DUF497 family protein
MEFDWHPAKRDKTLAERGIDFIDILIGFADPNRRITQDSRKDYGEVRYNMLAKCHGRVFHITFTPRGAVTWIISARKANLREQKRYEQG